MEQSKKSGGTRPNSGRKKLSEKGLEDKTVVSFRVAESKKEKAKKLIQPIIDKLNREP